MRTELASAVDAGRGAFVEVRFRHRWSATVVFRLQQADVATESERAGGVARCLVPGSGWGVVAFNSIDHATAAVRRARELSLELRPEIPIERAPVPVRRVEAALPLGDDPRTVRLDEKRGFLEQVTAELLGSDRRVVDSRVSYTDAVVESWLATSEGSWLHERTAETTLGALAVAGEDGAVERAVDSVALRGGWHAIQDSSRGLARRVAGRAVERLHAMPARPGRYTVVLDPRATGAVTLVAVVDRCRAPSRGLDRDLLALGTRLGPDCLTIGDDPTTPGLRTSLVLDDEGTPVTNTTLVQHGVVVGHLHTRETAARERVSPTGHALAPSLRSIPAARPTNTYFAQGRAESGRLLSDAHDGLYLDDVLVVGSEGRRLTLVPGFGRVIRRGELAETVKCPAITADVFALLGRLEAVAGDFVWDASASRLHEGPRPNRAVTTGAPHTRFVDVDVGAMYA